MIEGFLLLSLLYGGCSAWLYGHYLAELIYASVQNVMLEDEIKRLRGSDDK